VVSRGRQCPLEFVLGTATVKEADGIGVATAEPVRRANNSALNRVRPKSVTLGSCRPYRLCVAMEIRWMRRRVCLASKLEKRCAGTYKNLPGNSMWRLRGCYQCVLPVGADRRNALRQIFTSPRARLMICIHGSVLEGLFPRYKASGLRRGCGRVVCTGKASIILMLPPQQGHPAGSRAERTVCLISLRWASSDASLAANNRRHCASLAARCALASRP
jgi:hypothetical protein